MAHQPTRGWVFYFGLLIIFSGILSGCGESTTNLNKQTELLHQSRLQTAVAGTIIALTPKPPTQEQSLSPTEIPVTVTPAPTQVFVPQPTVDALVIAIPTPGPLPVSAWRPPLYPVPWALSEIDHFYLQRPIAVDTINWPVADYRYGGIIFGPSVVHTGVDIDAPPKTPILAAADGKVIWSGNGLLSGVEGARDDYGLAIAIEHDFGFEGQRLYTIYAHMSEVFAVDNQIVKAGDKIGQVGNTGETTGPHLHFEVRLGKNLFANTRNPELWIAPPQGWGVVVGRIMDEKGKPLTHIPVHIVNKDTGQEWEARTYGDKNINADEHYRENLVLSDLPAGNYLIWIDFANTPKYYKFVINPGAITFVTYWGQDGFQAHPTPTPSIGFLPDGTP